MEQNTTINASYRYHSRLKGEVEVQLFNDFYICVKEKPLKRTRQFKLEIATLNPQAKNIEDLAIQWLAAALIAALGAGFFLYTLFTGNGLLMPLLGALVAAALSAGFTALYFYASERKWVFETRNALYPLVVVPYSKGQKQQAKAFIKTLQQAIEKNVEKRHYSSEDLFAGELRMLRRLSNNKVLSDSLYEQAKAYMMKTHGSSAA